MLFLLKAAFLNAPHQCQHGDGQMGARGMVRRHPPILSCLDTDWAHASGSFCPRRNEVYQIRCLSLTVLRSNRPTDSDSWRSHLLPVLGRSQGRLGPAGSVPKKDRPTEMARHRGIGVSRPKEYQVPNSSPAITTNGMQTPFLVCPLSRSILAVSNIALIDESDTPSVMRALTDV